MPRVTDKQIWFDKYVLKTLDFAKESIENKFDMWMLVSGSEGTGKTTYAGSIGYYLSYNPKTNSSSFNVDNFVWTVEQFKKALTSVPEGSVIVWDEAVFGLLSTEAMSEVQRTLMKFAVTIRKRRLIILLLIPHVFMMGRYFVDRCKGMFHLKTFDGIHRGLLNFYNKSQMMYLYAEGKKHWSYPNSCKFSFYCQHKVKSLSELGIDEKEYERRKDLAIQELYSAQSKDKIAKDKFMSRFYKTISYIKEDKGWTWKELANELDLNMSEGAIQKGHSRYIESLEQSSLKPNKYLISDLK